MAEENENIEWDFSKVGTQKTWDSIVSGKNERAKQVEEIVKSVIEKAPLCLVDVVIAADVSGSMGYNTNPGGSNYGDPPSPMSQAQNQMIIDIITGFAPYMSSGDLQMGIVKWAAAACSMTNPNTGPMNAVHPWNEGVWLSDNPVALTNLASTITTSGPGSGTVCDWVGTNSLMYPGISRNNNLLNKAQSDPGNCSLGDRTGQTGFSRVSIIITDGEQPALSFSAGTISNIEPFWQSENVYGVKIAPNNLSPLSVTQYREDIQPLCGEAGTPTTTNSMYPWNGGDYDKTFAGGTGQLFALAQDIWTKICPPESFDCKGNYTCQDPGDGSGQYSVANGSIDPLNDCLLCCGPDTYECDNMWNCYTVSQCDPFFQLQTPGTYTDMSTCQAWCVPTTWDCLPNGTGCHYVPIPGPLGQYFSQQRCEDNCPVSRWTCVGRQHSPLSCQQSMWTVSTAPAIDPTVGIYGSLVDCQAGCVQQTWNCTTTGCVDPLDETGQYWYLDDCEEACTVYECVDLTLSPSPGPTATGPLGLQCIPRQGGTLVLAAMQAQGLPWYATYNDCLRYCYEPTWNCIFTPGGAGWGATPASWNCVDPLDGSGQYTSLAQCQYYCGGDDPINPGYDCVENVMCVPHTGTGVGQFVTLTSCQTNCGPLIGTQTPSWDCSISWPYGCFDPGTGLGQYTTLSACQSACIPPSWDCNSDGICIDPGTGNGQYPTLPMCQANCP